MRALGRSSGLILAAAALGLAAASSRHQAAEHARADADAAERYRAELDLADMRAELGRDALHRSARAAMDMLYVPPPPPPSKGWDMRAIAQGAKRGRKRGRGRRK